MDEAGTESNVFVERAVEVAGSQSALARLIGTSQATVWKWLNKGLPVTAELVLKIEAQTGISRHDLRPDIYPREEADAPRGGSLYEFGAAR